MFRHPSLNPRAWAAVVLALSLGLSGCGLLTRPVAVRGTAPTPVTIVEAGGQENPDVYVDPAAFQKALLAALNRRDAAKLSLWMEKPFLTGVWRQEALSEMAPASAREALLAGQLSASPALAVVDGADLKALMGGKDPLSMLNGATEVWLVRGWGTDGRDEALLFAARQADNSLKWRGWMQVKGGISGARMGGAQPYTNDYLGFSLYAPAGYSINATEKGASIIAPQGQGGHPGLVSIEVEAAMGRTSEAAAQFVIDDNRAVLGPGWIIPAPAVLDLDGEKAVVVERIPAQDITRRLYVVHDDLLYSIVFSPSNVEEGEPYWQMEDAYAMLTNTFHFLH